jgi:hypothetical protein
MKSGGKKKSPKTRRLEAMKHQMEGKVMSPTGRRATQSTLKKARMVEDAPPSGGSKGLVIGVVVLLLLGAGAAAFALVVLPKIQEGSGGGSASGTPEPSPEPDAKGAEPGPEDEPPPEEKPKPEDEPKPVRPPPPPPETLQWFTGTYKGVHPKNGVLSGALIFESEGKETVYITARKGYEESLVKGKKYKFQFRPDALFHSTKRIKYRDIKKEPMRVD